MIGYIIFTREFFILRMRFPCVYVGLHIVDVCVILKNGRRFENG